MTRDLFGMVAPPERVARIVNGVDLDLVLHHETQTDEKERGAILVSGDGYESRAVWLQKSKIEIYRGSLDARGIKRSGQIVRLPVITVTVPEGLAREKGVI